MADIESYLENGIVTMFEEREEFEPGSKEKIAQDKNINQMVDNYVSLKKLDADDLSEERRLEFEKSKFEAQINHDEKWKAEEMNQRISEHKDEIDLKSDEQKHRKKHDWAKIGVGALSLGATFGLHLLGRSDAREGIMLDDRLRFVDKAKNTIMGFLK